MRQTRLKLSGNGNEGKPLPTSWIPMSTTKAPARLCAISGPLSPGIMPPPPNNAWGVREGARPAPAPEGQGLTLVHFSAQLERFVWDRGCA